MRRKRQLAGTSLVTLGVTAGLVLGAVAPAQETVWSEQIGTFSYSFDDQNLGAGAQMYAAYGIADSDVDIPSIVTIDGTAQGVQKTEHEVTRIDNSTLPG